MNDNSAMNAAAVPFVKASACGNDFLIIDGLHAPPDLPAFSRSICDRHNGVGADGVEWLFPTHDADIRARLINADGSDAEISGNGTRCVAAYLCAENPRQQVSIRTGAGIKKCSLISRNQKSFEFEMSMGEPQVGDEFPIKLTFGEIRGIPVSMGNPHFVVFVDEFGPACRPMQLKSASTMTSSMGLMLNWLFFEIKVILRSAFSSVA